MNIPILFNISYVSLELCPRAKTSASHGISSPFTIILFIFPSLLFMYSSLEEKRTSPPKAIICFLIFLTTSFNISVPTCGFASYLISSGAPALTNSAKT